MQLCKHHLLKCKHIPAGDTLRALGETLEHGENRFEEFLPDVITTTSIYARQIARNETLMIKSLNSLMQRTHAMVPFWIGVMHSHRGLQPWVLLARAPDRERNSNSHTEEFLFIKTRVHWVFLQKTLLHVDTSALSTSHDRFKKWLCANPTGNTAVESC